LLSAPPPTHAPPAISCINACTNNPIYCHVLDEASACLRERASPSAKQALTLRQAGTHPPPIRHSREILSRSDCGVVLYWTRDTCLLARRSSVLDERHMPSCAEEFCIGRETHAFLRGGVLYWTRSPPPPRRLTLTLTLTLTLRQYLCVLIAVGAAIDLLLLLGARAHASRR
jgi:hypothetical protein